MSKPATPLPLADAPAKTLRRIDTVLCDLDDTLTLNGRLPAAAYAALETLQARGKKIVVVTGRPAGWCDLIARFWPVDGVVGENGAFYFRYVHARRRMVRVFQRTAAAREKDRAHLHAMFADLRRAFPGAQLAADQAFRISDIAVDFREDVRPIRLAKVEKMKAFLEKRGATVKISSIHLNAWIGKFDKLTMIKRFLSAELKLAPGAAKTRCVYVGDSPNDEPMFGFFPNSVGVANVRAFLAGMTHVPPFVTQGEGGTGFVEFTNALSSA